MEETVKAVPSSSPRYCQRCCRRCCRCESEPCTSSSSTGRPSESDSVHERAIEKERRRSGQSDPSREFPIERITNRAPERESQNREKTPFDRANQTPIEFQRASVRSPRKNRIPRARERVIERKRGIRRVRTGRARAKRNSPRNPPTAGLQSPILANERKP